jgi:tetratricopeptide (TPR) repeat protein
MRWRITVCAALMVVSVGAGEAWARGGQESQQKIDPEKAKALKEQNDKALAANALITQYNAAVQNKQWQQAADLSKQLIGIDPGRWGYWQGLGVAQLNLGQFDDAVKSFEAGIKLAQADISTKAPEAEISKAKAGIGMMLTNEGNCNLKLKKNDLAVAAYSKAAEMDPNPAVAYFNLCATQYNIGAMEGAVAACDKAIAADPKKADAYFIKGSAMFGNGKLDANNKYVVPPGTVEALKKYLELAPNGGHVEDVKAMLDSLGIKP